MQKPTSNDFRVHFASMADQAVISRHELAVLLSTTGGTISQMAYRGQLPPTAFPNKRKACWFVKDIRDWLDQLAMRHQTKIGTERQARTGRPRHSA